MATKILTRVGQLAYYRRGDNEDPDYLESLVGAAAKIPGLKTFATAASDYEWTEPFTTALVLEAGGDPDGGPPIWIAEWDIVLQRFNKVSEIGITYIPDDTLVRVYATLIEETLAAYIAERYT